MCDLQYKAAVIRSPVKTFRGIILIVELFGKLVGTLPYLLQIVIVLECYTGGTGVIPPLPRFIWILFSQSLSEGNRKPVSDTLT